MQPAEAARAVVLLPLGDLAAQTRGVEFVGAAGAELEIPADCGIAVLAGALDVVAADTGRVLASIKAATGAGEGVVLYARPATAVLRLAAQSRLRRIPFAALEAAISWNAEAASADRIDPQIGRRADWLRLAGPFWRLTLDEVVAVAKALEQVAAEAGEAIVTQGEKGEHFFVIETGKAEVWRTDPLTDETACVAVLGPGDTFGEEALLQEGMRNATVKASAPCRLLRLGRQDFDRHVCAGLLGEVDAQEARRLLDADAVGLIDCRYEIEHEASRIPGSVLQPLDRIRETGCSLKAGRRYVVYCRSGRRSRAAAFLLRQMGIDAISLKGGISGWPFAVEGDAGAH